MPDEYGNEYPQRVGDAEVKPGEVERSYNGPEYFKKGNNTLFMRPGKVLKTLQEEGVISFQCETTGFLNRHVYTHETDMFQFMEMKEEKGTLYVSVEFWSDSIFRVQFSEKQISDKKMEVLPDFCRMLTGTPETNVMVQVGENEKVLRISTRKMVLVINKENFCMTAYDHDNKIFWEQIRTEYFTSDVFDISVAEKGARTACFDSFRIRNQEEIYGLGERFDHAARKGKTVDFWNKDAIGTSNLRTYINVPFLFSTKGYGMFLNSSARTEWEIGTLEASTLGFSIEDAVMDYFIIYGPTPSEILYKYSTLTGFSPVPPVWSFGLWMSRNSYTTWGVVHEVARSLREKDIPADVLHLDTAWFKEDWNCDLKFSEERFPDPAENLKRLKEIGFRICLWQYNFVPPRKNNGNYREGVEKGYFVLNEDGRLYSLPEDAIGSWLDDAIIDFSNKAACEWYANKIKELIKLGAATIKTDFGEGIPEDGIYKNIDGRKFHNLYSLVYNSVVSEAIREVSGESIVWARSGTAGSQRYPIHWGGDSLCNFENLAGTLRAALSIGMSGFPFFSHDIGGFIGHPTPELYIRWSQFGLFSSHSRCHGAGDDNSREPWSFGEDAERIFRKYAKLRYSLLPYIYEEAQKCSRTAKPMVRMLLIEYPQDRNVWHIDDQYLFGDSLLIAPVLESLEDQKTRSLYLPEGIWFDYWTKIAILSRGEWIERDIDLETMPMYVKNESILRYAADRASTYNEIGSVVRIEAYGCECEEGIEIIRYHP